MVTTQAADRRNCEALSEAWIEPQIEEVMSKLSEQLEHWLDQHWGLTLTRNTQEGSGRLPGAWRTGWTVSGNFPGRGMDWVRYRTLREIAEIYEYPGPAQLRGSD